MSTKTLRKRLAITATSALLAGVLSVISSPASQAHNAVGSAANTATSVGNVAGTNTTTPGSVVGSLFTSTVANTTSAAVAATTTDGSNCSAMNALGRSKGLLYKDSSSGVAQSATVLAGGALSLYACTATAVAWVASGGSFVPTGGAAAQSYSFNSDNSRAWSANIAVAGGTGVAAIWTAPSTVGTYTVSLYTGYYTNSSGLNVISTATLGALPETLSGNITVTVVAASAGGRYDASNSACSAVRTTVANTTSNVDDSGVNANGVDWTIDLNIKDAYNAALPSGAIVASATNGALLAIGAGGATPVAGTSSTITEAGTGTNRTLRVSQGTAGVPVTTTVTISYNGTTVCTKTVSIAGRVANLTVSNVAVQDLSASAGNANWFAGESRAGTFYVVATDSAGNRIATPTTIGTYGYDAATLGTTVTNVTFDSGSLATSTSSTSVNSATVGRHTCAATAGTQKGVVLTFTLANGTVVKSSPTDLSCADDAASYTASFDKAKYISGEVAKLTITFKDSKGNAANNVVALGASSITVPGMTLVSTTGAASAVPAAGSKLEYTYTVGQTAGKYAAVVTFGNTATLAQFGATQNPSYEISTGGDTTTNADVLKSIVALIASINKQIQALQKLILRR